MSDDESKFAVRNDESMEARATVAVQFVFEVEAESVADRFLDPVPDPESPPVAPAGYRSYVDSAGLCWPVVGASVPYADRRSAEEFYETIRQIGDAERSIRSGTLALRRFDDGVLKDDQPVVVEATRYP